MHPLTETVVSLLLVIGGLFLFVGSYALVKLKDTLQRLHGPTKATTLGMGSILGASMLYFWLGQGAPSIHEILIALFLLLTAPISAHMIAKAHIHLAEDRPRLEGGSRKDGPAGA
ncbi:MAG TPA: Na+/H+ antiporter subunit G [Burkholderiales bacterium]|nr:Na+/H+ antiporter subunit G [Burkholderiales bacterium]